MTHGITININNVKDNLKEPAPPRTSDRQNSDHAVDYKDVNPNFVGNRETSRESAHVIISVVNFFSQNNSAPAQSPRVINAQQQVDNLPVVQDESCWKKYFCCCRR